MKTIGIQLIDSFDDGELMDLKTVIVRDGDGLITSGLVVGNVENQNKGIILIANPGEFHFSPTIGVAINDLILDDDYLRIRSRIGEHLQKDGFKVRRIDFSFNKPLVIDAAYE
jgi:hypothetical protein